MVSIILIPSACIYLDCCHFPCVDALSFVHLSIVPLSCSEGGRDRGSGKGGGGEKGRASKITRWLELVWLLATETDITLSHAGAGGHHTPAPTLR